MGRIIDRAVIFLLASLALYLLFLSAFQNIAVSCALTLLCMALLRRALNQHPGKARMSALDARNLLYAWALGSDEEARIAIAKLLNLAEDQLIYLPRHPTAAISLNDVFSAWKAHRNEKAITLAAPCRADGRARTYARSLSHPAVKLMDAPSLIARIRRSDLAAPRASQGMDRFARLKMNLAALPDRRPWHQNLLFGLLLMAVYLLTGNAFYLALSIGTLFLAGVAHRSRSV